LIGGLIKEKETEPKLILRKMNSYESSSNSMTLKDKEMKILDSLVAPKRSRKY